MSLSGLPFDDIRDLIGSFQPADDRAAKLAGERSAELAKVFGFGNLEADVCHWLSAWSGKSPTVLRPMIALFAGTHEVVGQTAAHGEKTLDQVTRMAAGGAPVNQVCAAHDIGLKVFDLALQYPVADISTGDALDEKGAAATIGFGMEAIAGGIDVLGLAAFGQGSEIANAAILSILFDQEPDAFLQHLPDAASKEYARLAAKAVERHKSAADDPLELLRRLGGREHSALIGAILAARTNHVPVVLDGHTAICVAHILSRLDGGAVDHCLFAGGSSAWMQDTEMEMTQALLATKRPVMLSVFAISNDGSSAGHAIAVAKSVAAVHANSVIEAG